LAVKQKMVQWCGPERSDYPVRRFVFDSLGAASPSF
jgi:hypothetical protein